MDKKFYSSIILLSVIQIQHALATGCDIVLVTSPSASTLNVQWNTYSGASGYKLDLRVVNSTSIAPLLVTVPNFSTQRLIQGLRSGRVYTVTMKVFQSSSLVCTDVVEAMTVPATSQFTFSQAISSTSIRFEWSSVTGADSYILFVEELFSSPQNIFSQTYTTLGAQVDGLSPSTTYSCYLYSSNVAGQGAKSMTKTIRTLVQPPTGVSLVKLGKSTARVTWNSVSYVLLYQVSVVDSDTSNPPVIRETSATFMVISGLEPCSTYTVGVSSLNVFSVPGEASSVLHITSTINPVTTVYVYYSCSSGMVTVTWTLVFGANMYRATAVDGTGESRNCTSNSTSCQIGMLKCGENYEVHVTAISDDCQSTSNVTAEFETVPCAPANPHTDRDCSSNAIIFKWEPTNNTFHYVATAVNNNNEVTKCTTAGIMCFFTNTACGQLYTFTVYAISHCNSEVSSPVEVRTAPCLPTNIRTGDECHSEKLTTTWDPAAGALSYTVEAQGNNGEFYNCTTNNTSCDVAGVPCGEHLSVWIVASNGDCSTSRVLGEAAQTVPCTPTNLSVSIDCRQDSAMVNWTTSIGAIFYMAIAEDANGRSHSCTSKSTSCLIEGLMCAQHYNATIIGSNIKCNSTISKEVAFMTAPCPPADVEAMRNCDANSALIVWQDHQPTGLYTATIADQSGMQLHCTSSAANNCTVPSPPCGKRYSVSVSYDDGECVSISAPISMDSVPCGPENVSTSVTCVTGELTVAWDIPVLTGNYTTIISKGMGQPVLCDSSETTCTTAGLLCGTSYTVTIHSITGTCLSLPSAEVLVQTVPCPPTLVSAPHTCAPDPVPVSWVASDSAKYYTAVAVNDGGLVSECTTNETSCSLPGLQCGQAYTIGVSGVDDNCTGGLSDTVSLNTEPCPPSNVSSQLVCSMGTAHVFWASSANAVSYSLTATSDGQTLTCSSPSPNCTLSNLVCGEAYVILVNATDGTCVSNYSASYRPDEVPCPPVNISTNVSCGTNDLTVSWVLSAVPLNYSVTVMPLAGNDTSIACDTSQASCTLRGLQCGRMYNVLIKASSGGCSGPYSQPQTVNTAPCIPQGLRATTDCGSSSLQAFWNASRGAASYRLTVMGPDGYSETCSSSNLTCSVSGLQCASQYNVTVASQDSQCTSSPSHIVLRTGPCDPVNVTSVLHCGSDMATVSWDAAVGALAYTVLAQEAGSQHYASCRSSTTSCQLSQLQCGKNYNLTVMAEDAACNSTGNISAVLMTAPCSPMIKNSSLICGTTSSFLSWMPMAKATGYVVNAISTHGHTVSCISPTATCTLNDLLCSETYAATVTAQGSQCDSAPSPSTNITTSSCPPNITAKHYTCSNGTAMFSWTDPMGSLSFLARAAADGYQDSCQTASTSCVLQNLPCGLDLNLTVQAQGPECNTSESVSESLQTVPCAPQNVSAALVCLNHSALVSWVESSRAAWYNVTLVAQDGHVHHCRTNSTWCQLPGIHCGVIYSVTVTPYSEMCAGQPSAVHVFRAGLCAPSNITVSSTCQDSIVSWSNVTGADMFIATATADDDHAHTCSSNDSNSCNFTDLHCSESYSVTVVTVDRGCRSEPSSAVPLRTALCPATNLTGEVSCDTNTVTLTWDQSPVPGASYSLQAERIGSTLPPSVHTTSDTSLTLTSLLCGQRYAFSIRAEDGNCSSSNSPPLEISTAPCQPTNFTARVDCGTNNGNFSWAEASGAEFYTVEVTGEHGHVASCSTNDTSCSIKLHCSRSYSSRLVASTGSCNGTQHAEIHFDSAPCLPEDVFAELQCNTNVMNVSWAATSGADSYTAWAISTDGHRAHCNSTSTSCCIHDLHCGQVYEVAVASSSVRCKIIAGSDYKVQSAPCKPENTSVHQNCSSNAVMVEWRPSGAEQNYTVTATSAAGVNSTRDSAESSCSLLDLSCGQLYTFTVTGHTNVCRSDMSTPVEMLTAPCPPMNVSAELNCSTDAALVSWSEAATATDTAYSVWATTNGHNASCSEMGTYCTLNNLLCGQEYSVVVEAMHAGCPGPASGPVMLKTKPCQPMNVSAQALCQSPDVQISWQPAGGSESYLVTATGSLGYVEIYSTNQTSLSAALPCGQDYNITVQGRGTDCDSITSNPVFVRTSPCIPCNVTTNAQCESNMGSVSWGPSDGAESYVATATGLDGHTHMCPTSATSCTWNNLHCGEEYTVVVRAKDDNCTSMPSNSSVIHMAPCRPQGVRGTVDCVTNSASISWDAAAGAESYSVLAVGGDDRTASCTASSNCTCEVEDLACGTRYNFSVTANNSACESRPSAAIELQTAACSLSAIQVVSQCRNASILVTWDLAEDSEGDAVYTATAESRDHAYLRCNSTGASCYLQGAQCDQNYTIVVSATDHCNGTRSPPHTMITKPCPPTNVVVNASCEDRSVRVSWRPSPVAETYHVVAVRADGHAHTCNTTDSYCSLSELHCEQQYTVYVKASQENCSSRASDNVTISTGPCQPAGLSVTYHCNNQSALLTWMPRDPAVEYYGCALVGDGDMLYCYSTSPMCTIQGLDCGATYNFSVRASDGVCNGSFSEAVQRGAAPCPPDAVEVQLLPMQMEAQVLRFSWTQDVCNGTEYRLALMGALLGDPLALFQLFSYWTRMIFFEMLLPCGSAYNATVESRNAAGASGHSEPLTGHTAPCPPTGATYVDINSFATVSWTASVFATTYTVYDGSVILCSGPDLQCILMNAASTILQITASNAAGESEATTVVKNNP